MISYYLFVQTANDPSSERIFINTYIYIKGLVKRVTHVYALDCSHCCRQKFVDIPCQHNKRGVYRRIIIIISGICILLCAGHGSIVVDSRIYRYYSRVISVLFGYNFTSLSAAFIMGIIIRTAVHSCCFCCEQNKYTNIILYLYSNINILYTYSNRCGKTRHGIRARPMS